MESVQCDVLPQGVTLKIGDVVLIGTDPIQKEKESA
jgi:hypothetical protein